VPMQLEKNPGSESMRYRLCINTRCSDPETKESLNSVLAKGPNCLADQIEILLQARSYPVMLVDNIYKAWNVICTTKVEKNLQRIVWLFGEEGAWQTFVVNQVIFGNKPATTLFEICIEKTAETFDDVDHEAADIINCDCYVNNRITAGTAEQVGRFIGKPCV